MIFIALSSSISTKLTSLDALQTHIQHANLLVDSVALALAVALAYALTWGWRRFVYGAAYAYRMPLQARTKANDGIWLGHSVHSGVVLPALTLLFCLLLQFALQGVSHLLLLPLAVAALLALTSVRFLARVLTLNFPESALVNLLVKGFAWVIWALATLWALGLWDDMIGRLDAYQFKLGKATFSMGSVLQALLYMALALLVALWLSAELDKRLYQRKVDDLSLRKIASNATRTLFLLVAIFAAFSAVGIDLTTFSVIGGALGLGLGFGLQKLAANYVSGFVILFERSVRIGDHVMIDGFEGWVTDIKTRYTLLRTLQGREAIIPNEKLIAERVENLSLANDEIMQNTSVSVAYQSDLPLVEKLMIDAAKSHPRVMSAREPAVLLMNFGADGLGLQLNYWISDPQNGMNNVRSDINKAIFAAFVAHGVEIPYPQRVLHSLPASVASSAQAVSAAGNLP